MHMYYNITYYIFHLLNNNQFYVFAHINGSKIQEIIDNNDGIKILFTYVPEKPIIDTFTKLYFSVQDLEGNHIKDVKASVSSNKWTTTFQVSKYNCYRWRFLVEYIFPDDGTHQVITRIDTKNIFSCII